ncbi:hypothetical protein Tco_1379011 [Tanacetum coccineum]
MGASIRRHTRSYYPKRYWELLPKEILGAITQRDTGSYYPKRYWELLPKEILGAITQRETGMSYGKMEDRYSFKEDTVIRVRYNVEGRLAWDRMDVLWIRNGGWSWGVSVELCRECVKGTFRVGCNSGCGYGRGCEFLIGRRGWVHLNDALTLLGLAREGRGLGEGVWGFSGRVEGESFFRPPYGAVVRGTLEGYGLMRVIVMRVHIGLLHLRLSGYGSGGEG